MAHRRRVEWDEAAGPAENAGRKLPLLVSAYFSEVRAYLADDPAPPELHQLRLASKRLRYTLELFRPCYPAGLEDRIRALKKLQDWLGEVNDAVASARLLSPALKTRPKLHKFLEDRAAQQAAGFTRHWNEIFDAPGREVWWMDFLAKPVTPTKNILKPINPKPL